MKSVQKIVLFSISAFLLFAMTALNKSPQENEMINLADAISSKKVSATITSNGKYRGRSVVIALTNNTSATLKIRVPAGTGYGPDEDGEQTLIQLEEEFFALAPKSKKVHTAMAFCTEASDKSPSIDGAFKLVKHKNKNLAKLVEYMKGKTIDKLAYQDAVWAITDGHSISNIQTKTPATTEFRKFVAELTGQKNTWYTSPQSHQTDEQRRILSQTIVIAGEIQFPSDGVATIHQEVIDKDGVVRFAMPPAVPKKSKNVTMDFSVRVRGWSAGHYTVRIRKGDEELRKYLFTIG